MPQHKTIIKNTNKEYHESDGISKFQWEGDDERLRS